jgi:hypothetical protein
MDTGIPSEVAIDGIKAIGLVLPMKVRTGWDPAMTDSSSSTATGKAAGAALNTIITGIGTTTTTIAERIAATAVNPALHSVAG